MDTIQNPAKSPDRLLGVVTQPTDSRLSETNCALVLYTPVCLHASFDDVIGDGLLVVNVEFCHLHVTLAGVFVSEVWSANGASPSVKFTIENIFRDTTISHSMDVTMPSLTSPACHCTC